MCSPPPRGSIESHAHSTVHPCSQMLTKPSKFWNKWFSCPHRLQCCPQHLPLPLPGLPEGSAKACFPWCRSCSQSSGQDLGLSKKRLVWSTPRCQKIDTRAGSKHTSQSPSRIPREEEMSLNNQVCHTDPLGSPSFLSLPSSTSHLGSGAPPSTKHGSISGQHMAGPAGFQGAASHDSLTW